MPGCHGDLLYVSSTEHAFAYSASSGAFVRSVAQFSEPLAGYALLAVSPNAASLCVGVVEPRCGDPIDVLVYNIHNGNLRSRFSILHWDIDIMHIGFFVTPDCQ